MFFLGKKYTVAFAWLCFYGIWFYSCLTQFLQTVEKSGDPAGAVSGVADLCGISEFHDQYFELK